jgi:ATP/maltotriose-dependent transcriptional regulator MalT
VDIEDGANGTNGQIGKVFAGPWLDRYDRQAAPTGELTRPGEPLTQGETRVLRYLSSNLSTREIAHELYLSTNTVKTHQRHLYRKLHARTRSQAVERARALGLLAPSSCRSASTLQMWS